MRREGSLSSAVALLCGVAALVFGVVRLSQALRSLRGNGPRAALNLKQRHEEVLAWFGGDSVYEALPTAVYPPGSMTLLAPLGWLDPGPATHVYATLTLLLCAGLAWWMRRSVRPDTSWVALTLALPLATLPLAEGIALGQLHLVSLVAAVAAVTVALGERSLARDLVAGALFAVALVKPSNTALFFWALLFLPGRIRPAAIAAALYGIATGVALAVRQESALQLLREWAFRAMEGARFGAGGGGYGSMHDLVAMLGLPRASVLATLLLLGGGGVVAWRSRRADPWLVLGVLGIAARLATYHRSYDDILILPAIAGALTLRGDLIALSVAGVAWLSLVTPAPPTLRVATWLALLVLLLRELWACPIADGEARASGG
ncbi:MAG: DUF2029 domain-containing protein [Deltaproteobacteria bacterium]|nr:DUF2029 domain-containing protein [Deltaproteobacteria bacterium]